MAIVTDRNNIISVFLIIPIVVMVFGGLFSTVAHKGCGAWSSPHKNLGLNSFACQKSVSTISVSVGNRMRITMFCLFVLSLGFSKNIWMSLSVDFILLALFWGFPQSGHILASASFGVITGIIRCLACLASVLQPILGLRHFRKLIHWLCNFAPTAYFMIHVEPPLYNNSIYTTGME